ncbi:MAG: hypothetical protein DWQ37_07920 [Planctomycetota bacterium]|nr:MAG: hypothetical protein DWQ37_07920 [Planctomycetota bacterium]
MTSLVLVVCSGASAYGFGLDPESNVDGFDPAGDLYRIGEARRLNEVARQLEVTRKMLWQNGYNPANPPIRQPVGYKSRQIDSHNWTYEPLYGEPACPVEVERAPAEDPGEPELLPAPTPVTPKRPARGTLPAPADAQPGDYVPPQNLPSQNAPELPLPRGRREF